MPTKFLIPKQSDRELIRAIGRIRSGLKQIYHFKFVASPPHQSVELPEESPETESSIQYALQEESLVIGSFHLTPGRGGPALIVSRNWDAVTDTATIPDEWINHADDGLRKLLPQLTVKLYGLIRSELKIAETEAALKGASDSAWDRYRDAQVAVINSLQLATENLIVQASQKNAELDKARAERFEKLESDLRSQLDHDRKGLQAEHERKLAELESRGKTLTQREAGFETKESHYVARLKQTEQIVKIQSWLDDWKLTKGTSRKRLPIAVAYIVAMVFTAALTISATWHSYDVLKSADEIVKLAWWQWAAIWAKSFFPLAAFATFVIYFIRWSGDWARQHSEEEFRNRTRLVDIGRSSWLLEAVRDAQERNKDIPPELLKELSRNLFTHTGSADGDVQPQAAADILLQGLSSLRVKSADGTEVEAKRGK